jgi:hypothetical protein
MPTLAWARSRRSKRCSAALGASTWRPWIVVVLVEQLDENGPAPVVLEGARRALVVDVLPPGGVELVVDAVHQVDVGVVVELRRGTQAEVLAALRRGEVREVAAHLRLARGGQREQEQRVDQGRHPPAL